MMCVLITTNRLYTIDARGQCELYYKPILYLRLIVHRLLLLIGDSLVYIIHILGLGTYDNVVVL